MGVINTSAYFAGMLGQIELGVTAGFIHKKYGGLVASGDTCADVVAAVGAMVLPDGVARWEQFPNAIQAEALVIDFENKK